MYRPPWEFTPWQMTITPRGFETGFHDRRKIFSPPIPSKVSSFTAFPGLRAMALS